jgi:hypothetical protein
MNAVVSFGQARISKAMCDEEKLVQRWIEKAKPLLDQPIWAAIAHTLDSLDCASSDSCDILLHILYADDPRVATVICGSFAKFLSGAPAEVLKPILTHHLARLLALAQSDNEAREF